MLHAGQSRTATGAPGDGALEPASTSLSRVWEDPVVVEQSGSPYQFPIALGIGILMRFGVPGPPPENSQAKMAIERITAMVKMS
jgi:hypothetical protein